MRHVPDLDGVRGFAIALVLVGHLFNAVMPEGGGFGVSLFLALSAYPITTILLERPIMQGKLLPWLSPKRRERSPATDATGTAMPGAEAPLPYPAGEAPGRERGTR